MKTIRPVFKRALACFLVIQMMFPGLVEAGTPVIPGLKVNPAALPELGAIQLPVLKSGGLLQGVEGTPEVLSGKMVVHQNQDKAIVDWEQFNIGKEAWTHFDQQGHTDWAALNRIFDQNPTLIYGKLSADGNIYLINQNGILFGPDARVDLHGLTASTLSLKDSDFLNNILAFGDSEGGGESSSSSNGLGVSNFGAISAGTSGSVFLIGENVENGGVIEAPVGQIGLIAGTEAVLEADTTPNSTRSAKVVKVKSNPGSVTNREEGKLYTDNGLAGMYGRQVNQDGVIRAVTAIKKAGKIELHASEKISTGPKSITATPVSESSEKVNESFPYNGGEIVLQGLDAQNPLTPQKQVGTIEHRGVIEAPSGTVSMKAENRIFLEKGSKVDVSGVWIDKPAGENITEVQLNSVQLKDDFSQKEGALKGEALVVNSLYGSSIGDVSGALSIQEKTALERSTTGGEVYLTVENGDFILKDGGVLDFSGGGIRYQEGLAESGKLYSGWTAYDASNAPGSLSYDGLLNRYTRMDERYGMVKAYAGLYFGGANPIRDSITGYDEGADAGSLTLVAKQLVLDGTLDGGAVRGAFQNLEEELTNANGYQMTRGRKAPKSGRLILGQSPGNQSPELIDAGVERVEILAETPCLAETFGPEDMLDPTPGDESGNTLLTRLSAEKMNAWNLGSLSINANTSVDIQPGAGVQMMPGGTFSISARRIENDGEVLAPAGTIRFTIGDNLTSLETIQGEVNSRYVNLESRILLESGSVLSAAGETLNVMGSEALAYALRTGGSVFLEDKTQGGCGVAAKTGARVDVSGGWLVDNAGKITGGGAGTINVAGSALVLEAQLTGHSLTGYNGGTFTAHARTISVKEEALALDEGWVLVPSRFEKTGFTTFKLLTENDAKMNSGTLLAPSSWKLSLPEVVKTSGAPFTPVTPVEQVMDHLVGQSGVSIQAGVPLPGLNLDGSQKVANTAAKILLEKDSSILTAIKGTIALEAPHVSVAGGLTAKAGKISLKSGQGDIDLSSGALLHAAGWIIPSTRQVLSGLPPGFTALHAGTLSLAAAGDIHVAQGVRLDVSGTPAAKDYMPASASGNASSGYFGPTMLRPVASNTIGLPGSISFSYYGDLSLEGELRALAGSQGVTGGKLSITRKNLQSVLEISEDRLNQFITAGFDDIALTSWKALAFTAGSGSEGVWAPRSLLLDAPEIRSTGLNPLRLGAPRLQLVNSYFPSASPPETGGGELILDSQWLDVTGGVSLSGFSRVSLYAEKDLRFSDAYYQLSGQTPRWDGRLVTSGNLTLEASRIYPATESVFTVAAGGNLVLAGAGDPAGAAVYSAGGDLTLKARTIDHQGVVYAPMGKITLEATNPDGRIYLGEYSVLSTTGSLPVKYGTLDQTFWTQTDRKTNEDIDVVSAPDSAISLAADEIIMREGAMADASGGGSLFAYQFQPGVDGSKDPLKVSGRYVIVPDGSIVLPGSGVYVGENAAGLAPGYYSLLSEEYAFLPGAVLLEKSGEKTMAGIFSGTSEGYPLLAGYFTDAVTGMQASNWTSFSVRPADSVFSEGFFNRAEQTAGNGGLLSFTGKTTIVDGTLRSRGLEGYKAGTLALAGTRVNVLQDIVPLPDGFGMDTPIPVTLSGTLNITGHSISGPDFKEIQLGSTTATETLTVEAGSSLEALSLKLMAKNEIRIEKDAIIKVSAGENGGGVLGLYAPSGAILLEENAEVDAARDLVLDARTLDLSGRITLGDGGALTLAGDGLVLGPDEYQATQQALVLEERFWRTFGQLDNLVLKSRGDLVFAGDVEIETRNGLTLDAARFAGLEVDGTNFVDLASGTVRLLNSGATAGAASYAGNGNLSVQGDSLTLGSGAMELAGFEQVNLAATGDITTLGKGSLASTGNLRMEASRLTTAPDITSSGVYEMGDFQITVPGRLFTLTGGNTFGGGEGVDGGKLSIQAGSIRLSGVVDLPSGLLSLETLEGDLLVEDGGKLLARGGDMSAGGRVELKSSGTGVLSIAEGALVDVSAGTQGDAGTLILSSPANALFLAGTILGQAQGHGTGAILVVDVRQMEDFASLNQSLAGSGFTEGLDLRIRQGNLRINPDQTIQSRYIQIAADAGGIQVEGVLDTSGTHGGSIGLFSGSNLILADGSRLDASASGPEGFGGGIALSSASGDLIFSEGADMDVSGAGGGGTVSMRALQQNQDVRITLEGKITGVSELCVEAFKVYEASTVTTAAANLWRIDAQAFMNQSFAIENRLLTGLNREGWEADALHLLPGVEVRSAGDMTLAQTLDLTSWRFGAEPGVLTLRAGGNLTINAGLVDHPTPLSGLPGSGGRDTWAMNLIAGADEGSAKILAVNSGTGQLAIADGQVVYTESAPLRFASGRDIVIGSGAMPDYMIRTGLRYNLGTYDGEISGKTGRDLVIQGGAIQSALGDIALETGRNLSLQVARDYNSSTAFTSLGTIRTTGVPTTGTSQYWTYGNGGNILLKVGGSVISAEAANAWDHAYGTRSPYTWAPSFETHNTTEGLATLGGGNLSITAGGSFNGQAGTFGTGNLQVASRGSLGGRFLVKQGEARVMSLGSAGSASQPLVFEAFDADITAGSMGDMGLGTVVNPTIARTSFAGTTWQLTYGLDASVSLMSKTGDVRISGDSPYYNLGSSQARLERILPPSLSIAAGRDILITNELALAPSPWGQLSLQAGRNIDGYYSTPSGTGKILYNRALISMADMDPASVYGLVRNPPVADFFSRYVHDGNLSAARDAAPVSIFAGNDITNMQFYLAKASVIAAGRDVRDMYYIGQNIRSDDVTSISAGRDIYFSTRPGSSFSTGIEHGGPGLLRVTAGNSIDLGTTRGVSTFGNAYNPVLGSRGSDILVMAGYDFFPELSDTEDFFENLREGGVRYSNLLAEGSMAESQMEIEHIKHEVVETLLHPERKKGSGEINITSSQIVTSSGSDHIYILSGGAFNVGKTTFVADATRQSTGVYTAAGGSINIYSEGDLNVNESRVMTFRGGDITTWSNQGGINAGRGSKTSVNVDPPKVELIGDQYVLVFRPPAVGSGIRTLTYDPDGLEGPLAEPSAGDIYAFAPRGVIDAGEAGIAGNNVILGATKVLNAQNIDVAGLAVGVPQAAAGPSMGTLAGAGTVSETGKMSEESTAMQSAEERFANRVASISDQLVPKWIAVEVVGFEKEDGEKEDE